MECEDYIVGRARDDVEYPRNRLGHDTCEGGREGVSVKYSVKSSVGGVAGAPTVIHTVLCQFRRVSAQVPRPPPQLGREKKDRKARSRQGPIKALACCSEEEASSEPHRPKGGVAS